MKLVIDISKDRYDEIMAMDWKNCRRFFDEEIRAIHDGKVIEQEPCGDCISRHDAIHLADKLKDDLPDNELLSGLVIAHNEGNLEYRTKLSLLPSVTPEQSIGRWIRASAYKYDGKRECTKCGGWWIYGRPLPDYCPHCGKKMEDGG